MKNIKPTFKVIGSRIEYINVIDLSKNTLIHQIRSMDYSKTMVGILPYRLKPVAANNLGFAVLSEDNVRVNEMDINTCASEAILDAIQDFKNSNDQAGGDLILVSNLESCENKLGSITEALKRNQMKLMMILFSAKKADSDLVEAVLKAKGSVAQIQIDMEFQKSIVQLTKKLQQPIKLPDQEIMLKQEYFDTFEDKTYEGSFHIDESLGGNIQILLNVGKRNDFACKKDGSLTVQIMSGTNKKFEQRIKCNKDLDIYEFNIKNDNIASGTWKYAILVDNQFENATLAVSSKAIVDDPIVTECKALQQKNKILVVATVRKGKNVVTKANVVAEVVNVVTKQSSSIKLLEDNGAGIHVDYTV